MKNFFLKTFLFFLAIFMVGVYAVIIPVAGDWLKKTNIDNAWIVISVVLFFSAVTYAFLLLEKRADRKWLQGEYDNEVK